jgi:hypothetical protein
MDYDSKRPNLVNGKVSSVMSWRSFHVQLNIPKSFTVDLAILPASIPWTEVHEFFDQS